ncbi:MAG: fibronectin type III domain-containing protein [Clostridiales bacterium]|nr:fibronectin type III domain-containing protein [Clostridiales bacterium]
MIFKNRTKHISFLLALIMLLSVFTVPSAVIALPPSKEPSLEHDSLRPNASPNLYFTQTMTEGTTNSYPVKTNTSIGDHVFFNWEFSQFKSGGDWNNATHELFMNLDDNETGRLIVKRLGNIATVEFQLEDGSAGPAASKAEMDAAVLSGSFAVNTFQVYSNRTGYVNVDDFMGRGLNTSERVKLAEGMDLQPYVPADPAAGTPEIPRVPYPNYGRPYGGAYEGADLPQNYETGNSVISTIAPTDRYHPMFILTGAGGGSSFKYGEYNIHFKWDEATGEFWFSINNLIKGRIYDFTLSYWNGVADNPVAADIGQSEKKILLGLADSATTPQVIPRANGAAGVTADGKPVNPGYTEEVILDKTGNIAGPFQGVGFEGNAGDVRADIDFKFTMPSIWDTAARSFVPISADTDLSYPLPFVMSLSGGSRDITISYNDLLELPAGGGDRANHDSWVAQNGYIPNFERASGANAHQITMHLYDLDPSTYFANILWGIENPMGSLLATPDLVPLNKPVYTFVRFGVTEDGDDYTLWFNPYRSTRGGVAQIYRGVYEIYATTNEGYSAGDLIGYVNITGTEERGFYSLGFDPEEHDHAMTYHLVFKPEATGIADISSQHLRFEPSFTPPIGSPKIFRADIVSMRPYPDSGDETAELILDLTWDIGTQNNINFYFDNNPPGTELTAEYEFRRGLTNKDDADDPVAGISEPFVKLGVIITRDVTINPNGTTSGAFNVEFYDIPLDASEGITGKLNTKATQVTTLLTELGRYEVKAQIAIDAGKAFDTTQNRGFKFYYPGVYFIKTQPRTVTYEKDGITYQTGAENFSESSYDSITLSDIETTEITPPQNLIASNPTETGFTVSWSLGWEGLQRYIRNRIMLTDPAPDNIDSKLAAFMNVYITTNEQYLRDNFSVREELGDYMAYLNNFERRLANIAADPIKVRRDDISVSALTGDGVRVGNTTYEDTVYFSQVSVPAEPTGSIYHVSQVDGKDSRIYLRPEDGTDRKGDIIALTGLKVDPEFLYNVYMDMGRTENKEFTLILDGLDPNQKYYVYVDLVLDLKETGEYTASKLSNMVTITTKDDMEVPTGEDKVPSAPIFWSENVMTNEADILWNAVKDDTTAGNTKIEYEIIRLKDTQMPDSLLNARDPMRDVWANLAHIASKVGLKTSVEANKLSLFDGTAFTGESELYEPFLTADPLRVHDTDLLPNQIYYYYIRTVKTQIDADGAEIPPQDVPPLYSVWSRLTITTDIIKQPLNLKLNDEIEYEEKSEIVIEFDALQPPTDELGRSINFQYQLKNDTDPWGPAVLMDAATLKASAVRATNPNLPGEGYWHYIYKISGLEASTSYQVRVRMTDSSGDTSMWSNIVPFRTGFDNDEYDDDWETDSWVDRLKELLDKLLKNPYWVSKKSPNEYEIMYRPDRFGQVLAEAKDSAIILPTANTGRATYYIPASALISANGANKGFKASHDGMDVFISPGAVSDAYNDAILKMGNELKSKNAQDYFLRIQIDWSEYLEQVEGNEPLSDQATVKVEVSGANKLARTIDDEIMTDFVRKIESKITDPKLKEQIRQNVMGEMISEDFVKYIEKIVADTETEFAGAVNTKLSGSVKQNIAVTKFDKPISIIANGIDPNAAVTGYSLQNGSWIPQEAMPYGQGRAMQAAAPGSFIFTGRVIEIEGIEKLPYGGNISGIAAKYGLDDFLGANGAINMDDAADRSMVISSVARMAGAPRGSDGAKWLRDNLGITVSTRNLYGSATTEEAVYLVMSLYEAKSKTKLSTIRIRNLGATANISGMNENYKQHIRAAFELGIYTNTKMQPKGSITIKDLFEMLGKLDAKVKM